MKFEYKIVSVVLFAIILSLPLLFFKESKYETRFKVGDCVLKSNYGKWEIINRGFKLVEKDGYLFRTDGPLVEKNSWYVLPPATISAEELERYYRTVTCP